MQFNIFLRAEFSRNNLLLFPFWSPFGFRTMHIVGSNYRKYWPYLEKIATETFVIFPSCMGP